MKPCSRNRKLITWLALDVLEAPKAAALRDHLSLCQGCRRYWEKISRLTETLASAQPDSKLEATELFHQKLAERLQAVESPSLLEELCVWLHRSMLGWRVALPAIVVLAIVLLAIDANRRHSTSTPQMPVTVQAEPTPDSEDDLAPTIGNYEMVANQSFEKLQELLDRQGEKSLPPVPDYTASSLTLSDAPFE
jgi:predicted anti-sigma-YlaC factor YlaD